jgi:NTP pyrophosphatase (non-canonical NTP hydrolase)
MNEPTRSLLGPDLVRTLLEFRRGRDWEQFHTPKNIASAIAVEAAELLEHFVWDVDPTQSDLVTRDRASIEAEVADMVILLTYLIHDLSIDVSAAVSAKVAVNAAKYPVETFYGSNRKYTDP